jgi:hypothetical protein
LLASRYYPTIAPPGLKLIGTVPRPEPVPAPGVIEGGDGTVRSTHKTVIYVARVDVISRDGPRRVDAGPAYRALEEACTRAWNIERGDGIVANPHKAVK